MSKQNTYWNDDLHGVDGTVTLTGYFVTNSTSDPATTSKGPYTITRTGVGTFRVTLKEPVTEVLYANGYLKNASTTERAYQSAESAGSSTANASADFVYETPLGTAADSTGETIRFHIVVRKSARKAR